jgi:hypothetical protein
MFDVSELGMMRLLSDPYVLVRDAFGSPVGFSSPASHASGTLDTSKSLLSDDPGVVVDRALKFGSADRAEFAKTIYAILKRMIWQLEGVEDGSRSAG